MWTKTQNRLLALTLLSAATRFHAQSENGTQYDPRLYRQPSTRPQPAANAIPAIAPTTAAPTTAPPSETQPVTQSYVAPPQPPARRATISYAEGRLTIVASNSSLNQILRDVSHSVSMKVTGGVAEERVFGTYGPGTPLEVLSTLLDGTGSNMLLIEGSADHPSELILSARNGGPTPPNPNAVSFDAGNDDQNSQRPAMDVPPSQREADLPPGPVTPPPSGDDSPQSPTGSKTPQQIYDELMKMRRQNQQQPPQ